MSKYLSVVAFAVLVLTGAMGLKNIVAAHAMSSNHSAPVLLAQGGPFPPPPPPGGGH